MYLERTAYPAPACPDGWQTALANLLYTGSNPNYRAACTTSQVCAVLYLEHSTSPAPACPAGWQTALAAAVHDGSAANYRATCYKC